MPRSRSLAPVLLLVLAGCSGDEPARSEPAPASPASPAAAVPSAPPPADADPPPDATSDAGIEMGRRTPPARPRPADAGDAVVAVDADAPPAVPAASSTAAPPDDPEPIDRAALFADMYGRVLREVVTPDGLVRYDKLATAPMRAALEQVVRHYGETALPAGRAERLALWCNAYNANVLAAVLRERERPGFTTVVEAPGFFDERRIRVAGEAMTLNDLENTRVRPLGDARVHAALVCAAMSCPPLRSEPFAAARLDAQLDDQCRRWVNDASKFRLVDGRLGLSEILKWYGEDFQRPPYATPVAFVVAYAAPGSPITRYVVNADPVETTWLPYDWTLNQASIEGGGK